MPSVERTYNTFKPSDDVHGGVVAQSSQISAKHVVQFTLNDPDNPRNWSPLRKWTIVSAITIVDLTVSFGASGFSPASSTFIKEFQVSKEVSVLGLSLYVLGLALGPMFNAPLSEHYGRTSMYVIPYGIFLLLLLGTASVTSLGGFLVLRLLSGFFSSVTIANFGGTIADMWPRDQVGPAMSVFLWAGVCGSSMGFFLMSLVAQSHDWRTVVWTLLGICGGSWMVMSAILLSGNETRHNVILKRKAQQIRGDITHEVDVPRHAKSKSIVHLFQITLSRPMRFLTTEAIIIFAALYNGYLYGLSFLFNDAFSLVFGSKGYGFDVRGVGMTFLALVAGISIGPIINVWQETYYQRHIRAGEGAEREARDGDGRETVQQTMNIPEARLQLSKVAAVTLPISLWWFAWTCVPSYHIHFMVPVLAMGLFGWSFYTLILMTYLYVEDSYMAFSASALAGVGLVRNLAGATFPLFGNQMYENEGYNWTTTILACLAMILIPIPFVLERYGSRLRARSPWARQHMNDDDDNDDEGSDMGVETGD